MTFIQQNFQTIMLVIAVLAIIIFMWYNDGKKNLRLLAHNLVEEAENKYGGTPKTGEVKYKYVVDAIYPLIPPTFKIFVSEKLLSKVIEEGVLIIKMKTDAKVEKPPDSEPTNIFK